MEIKEITKHKEAYKDILLIGDEDINMVNKYLHSGNVYALYEGDLRAICVVLTFDDTVEIKNLGTYPKYRNMGYASKLIGFVCEKYKKDFKTLILGTGENEKTLNFYKKRGFVEFKRVKNFFTENYPNPIFEDGKQLVDMIYLRKKL